jgi:hypothetical protein
MKRQQLARVPCPRPSGFIACPFTSAVLRSRIEKALVAEDVRVVQLADGTPRPTAPPDTCRTKLAEVDFAVICLGQHPGSFLPYSDNETYTGLEIRGSILLDLPVVALLMHDDARIRFGSATRSSATAEALDRQRRAITTFFSPSYFVTGADVELQVTRAVREWVPGQIAERHAIKRIQAAHMAAQPLQSNSHLTDGFSCTVEIKQLPRPITAVIAQTLGLPSSYFECFCSISGLGTDWVFLPEDVWSRIATTARRPPLLVRGKVRCLGRLAHFGASIDVGGFAMEELISSC